MSEDCAHINTRVITCIPHFMKTITIWSFVVVVLYLLAYAPLYSVLGNRGLGGMLAQRKGWETAFFPVDYITCYSPLRQPLLLWADFFGVEAELAWRSAEVEVRNDVFEIE